MWKEKVKGRKRRFRFRINRRFRGGIEGSGGVREGLWDGEREG